ncbi:MAG TPA: nucleoside transporter C-terminal domain-containing protein [Pirellulales bacterium]|nr:nucleoside transporter C-terminal domain-containing protein [Pirellulales bacterium]
MLSRFISLAGLLVIIGLAWLMSSHRRTIPWRVIAGGLLLQFALAVVVLKTDPGQWLFTTTGDLVTRLLDFVDVGAAFVFGPNFHEFPFAFKVLPTIIFFSSLMSVLYYFGIMQLVTRLFAVVMQRLMNTSGAESLASAANIFVGPTEAALVIRPYIASMTSSELMAVMIGGFANAAGGVLAVYVSMGMSAGHLITASLISAPASLLLAKVMEPELGEPVTRGRVKMEVDTSAANAIHAAALGAAEGLKLALTVGAMIIAFLALIAMLDAGIVWLGAQVGQSWSLAAGLSYAFAPLAFVMGIEPADCLKVGELLGIKVVANEIVAFKQLAEWLEPDSLTHISDRSRVIITYALCGFSNLGTIGIQIGGIGPMAPEREGELARFGLRAMLGGLLASCMTACIAGVLV